MLKWKNATSKNKEHFFHSCKNQSKKKNQSWNCIFASWFHQCHCNRNEGDEMEDKVRKEMQSPLIQLKLKMIRNNVDRWDALWASHEGHYKEMSEDEIRAFNAELHVIANDTMNELSSIRKRLLKMSVPFEEKSPDKSSSSRLRR